MRTRTSLSPSSETFSLPSSFDALSLTTTSRRSSAQTRASSNSQSDGFEHVVPSSATDSQRSSVSPSSASSAPLPPIPAGHGGRSTQSDRPEQSKAAARRGRQRKLREANRGGAVDVPPGGSPKSSATIPVAAQPIVAPPALHVPPSENIHDTKGKGKKTRRGGKKNRGRLDKAAVRNFLVVPGRTGPPSPQAISDDDEYSEDGASRFLDEELDDEDEVDGMSALDGDDESVMGTPKSSIRRVEVDGSVMSSEDAKTSIDSFLSRPADFMSERANKLRLWQALCVELQLVQIEGDDDLPDLPSSMSPQLEPRGPGISSPSSSRASTPRPALPPLPQSLKQAQAILKARGHVNLADYFEMRIAGGDVDYSGLLYSSASVMVRETRRTGKFVDLGKVKSEWLQPLLRDFGFKRGRMAAR